MCLQPQVYGGEGGALKERLRQLFTGTCLLLTVNSDDPGYMGGYVNGGWVEGPGGCKWKRGGVRKERQESASAHRSSHSPCPALSPSSPPCPPVPPPDNYLWLAEVAGLGAAELAALAAASFEASLLLSPEDKARHIAAVHAALEAFSAGAGKG